MSIVDSVKHAPRWAWITAGGVGIGAGAVKLYRNRAVGDTPPDAPGTVVDGGGTGTALAPASGYPGVVVPPVIIGNQTPDQNQGVGVLQDLYVGAISDVVSGWGGLVQQLIGGQQDTQNQMWDFLKGQQGILTDQLQSQSSTIAAIASAGGAPGQAISNPSPIVISAPIAPPPPTPAPAPPVQPKVRVENRTRDNGRTGAARRVWCNRVHIHDWPDGRSVVVSEDKIHDGAC